MDGWIVNRNGECTPPNERFIAIDAGDWITCGIKAADGSIACWGSPSSSTFTLNYEDPVPAYLGQDLAPTGTDYVQVACSTTHSCALHSSGSVVCWGGGDDSIREVPQAMGPFTMIDVHHNYTIALTETGGVVTWGPAAPKNDSTFYEVWPSSFSLSQPMISVAAGYGFVCAVNRDGIVGCWGNRGHDNPTGPDVYVGGDNYRTRPNPPPPLERLSAGQYFVCGAIRPTALVNILTKFIALGTTTEQALLLRPAPLYPGKQIKDVLAFAFCLGQNLDHQTEPPTDAILSLGITSTPSVYIKVISTDNWSCGLSLYVNTSPC
jgi:hypothetical protein